MIRCLLLLSVLLLPQSTIARGTGDMGLVIERASGSVQIIETSNNSSLGRIEGLGDLYVHSQESDMLAPLVGTLTGFLTIQDQTANLQVLQATLLDHSQAWGLYRWPTGWGVNWVSREGSGHARLRLEEMETIGNWVIGGFAMGVVRGTVYFNGKDYPAYGLAELIM